MICKDILQQYYQLFSAVDTAMENHLEDYWGAIKSSLIKNWSGLILMLVIPGIVCAVVSVRTKERKRKWKRIIKQVVVLGISAVLLHLLALTMVKCIP